MRYALPLVLLASPALAHHEAVVVSFVPTLTLWAVAVAGAGFALWRRWRRK